MIKIIRKNFVFFLIVISALAVRMIGVQPGYPPIHSDEPMSYSGAIYMLLNRLKPDYFYYPAGVSFLHSLIYRFTILPVSLFKIFFPHPQVFLTAIKTGPRFLEEFQVAIFGERGLKALFLSRYISALIGSLTVPLLYCVTKKLFNKTSALVAIFFLAFNYRHVLGSHFGLPDVHNAFFSLLAFGASVLLLEKNTPKRYLLAGAAIGLSLSIKYQIFSLLPFLLVHLIWTVKKRNWRNLFHQNFIQSLILIPIVFLILNPYLLFNLKEAVPAIEHAGRRYGMGLNKFHFYPYFYLYHWGIGRLPSLAIILGSALALILKPQTFFLIFSFIFPFFFVMTYYSYGGYFVRNFASAVPLLFIFAGFFFNILFKFFQKLKFLPANLIVILLVFYFNFIPIKNSFITSLHYTQPWNFTKINNWLIEKIPSNTKIRTYNIPLDGQTQKILGEKGVELLNAGYTQGPNSLAEFQKEGTDFVITNSESLHSVVYWWIGWSPDLLLKYNNVPFEFVQNSYFGLTFEELLNYTVYEVYKPWQAYDHNCLIFKIPPEPEKLGEKITAFGFDEKSQTWQLRNSFDFEPFKFGWSEKEGKKNTGALVILPESRATTSRLSSPPVPVIPGRLYTVEGWIKNQSEEKSNIKSEAQDCFLRIDFYQNSNEKEFEQLGTGVALSPLVSVDNQWSQVQASSIAPPESHYLTVSFQTKQSTKNYSSFLDDVEIFETEIIPDEKFPEIPYIKPGTPLEGIYLNSFL